jgi:hypothetical protein
VECIDEETKENVCMKIVKNNKEYFDQSLDEIKILQYLNMVCISRCIYFFFLRLLFIYLFIYLFIHSFIYLCIYLFIHSFIPSFIHLFIHSFIICYC